MAKTLIAGSTQVDITPSDSCFLWGYPHVERWSTGVFDNLYSSSLYLSDGRRELLFIANDLIFVSKELCERVREAIHKETGVPKEAILISATHTHSGPTIVNYASNAEDPHVPLADEEFLNYLVHKITLGACESVRCTAEAEIGQVYLPVEGVGTNRKDPEGPNDNEASLMLVRTPVKRTPIAAMVVYGMHPTILHEDSTLISADFPGMVRNYFQDQVLGTDCPVIYHNGVCGNLSPRHTAQANTLDEMMRIGFLLGRQLAEAMPRISFVNTIELGLASCEIEPNLRTFPSVDDALCGLKKAKARYDQLKEKGAAKATVRSAECDVFGAEETLTLAKASTSGRLKKAAQSCLPAEVSLFAVGEWLFLSWPGEFFVEYSLILKQRYENLSIISMANGELQGYIVTEEAAIEGGYEASNALFSFENGMRFIDLSDALIRKLLSTPRRAEYVH
jgi:hypothetical protein